MAYVLESTRHSGKLKAITSLSNSMLRKFWHFTKRLRWPLVAALLTLVLLGYLLQPRPEVEHRFPLELRNGVIRSVQVSPSGKHLLLLGYEAMLQLRELNGMKLIFDHFPKGANPCGFNSNDELVFYSREDDSFWCWKPDQTEPQKVGSHNVCWIDGERRNRLEGAERFYHLNLSEACLLSPDARTWLIAVGKKEDRHFVLIDARTGQERARLQLDASDMKKMQRVPLEAIFSPDSKVLLAQTQEPLRPDDETKEGIDLFWFDVQTGKKIRSKQLSNRLRMGDIGFFQNDRVFGISNIEEHDCLQTYSDKQGYRLFSLSETIAEPVEQPWPKASDEVWRAHAEIRHRFDATSNTVTCFWSHVLFPKIGALGGGAPSMPGFYYSVRDIVSGKLIRTEQLWNQPLTKSDDWTLEDWEMIDVLPGTVLMLNHKNEELPVWQSKWEAWRSKNLSWFPTFANRESHLIFIEAITGKCLSELFIPFTEITHFYHEQQQALYLVGHTDDQVVIQKYAYPLHKPWLLILSWTFGVFAALASLQWILHKLRR